MADCSAINSSLTNRGLAWSVRGRVMIADTPDFDPRTERAQTIAGAKARYVKLDDYTLSNLEYDLERLLREGECPDTYPPELTEPEFGYI